MNNLIENYEIILNNLKLTCGDINSFTQIRTPKLNNLELVSLNLTAEYISINTEVQLFRCLKGSYLETKIERSVYNKRRRELFKTVANLKSLFLQRYNLMMVAKKKYYKHQITDNHLLSS